MPESENSGEIALPDFSPRGAAGPAGGARDELSESLSVESGRRLEVQEDPEPFAPDSQPPGAGQDWAWRNLFAILAAAAVCTLPSALSAALVAAFVPDPYLRAMEEAEGVVGGVLRAAPFVALVLPAFLTGLYVFVLQPISSCALRLGLPQEADGAEQPGQTGQPGVAEEAGGAERAWGSGAAPAPSWPQQEERLGGPAWGQAAQGPPSFPFPPAPPDALRPIAREVDQCASTPRSEASLTVWESCAVSQAPPGRRRVAGAVCAAVALNALLSALFSFSSMCFSIPLLQAGEFLVWIGLGGLENESTREFVLALLACVVPLLVVPLGFGVEAAAWLASAYHVALRCATAGYMRSTLLPQLVPRARALPRSAIFLYALAFSCYYPGGAILGGVSLRALRRRGPLCFPAESEAFWYRRRGREDYVEMLSLERPGSRRVGGGSGRGRDRRGSGAGNGNADHSQGYPSGGPAGAPPDAAVGAFPGSLRGAPDGPGSGPVIAIRNSGRPMSV